MSDPKLVPNMFSSYALTAEQETEGSKLTTLQMMSIQNQLSIVAINRTNLEMNADTPAKFIQEEAYLKGQQEQLQFLLDASVAAIQNEYIVDADAQE